MQRIGFIVFPGFQVMSFAVISVFEFANLEIGEPVYDVQLLSETGRRRSARSVGMSVAAEPFDDTNFDTLIVGGGTVIEPSTPRPDRICAAGAGAIPAGRRDLHRRVHPGRSGSARRPARDHALVSRARFAGALPESEDGGRPHLHRRRPGMDLGRDDRGHRPCAGDGREGSWRGRRPRRGQEARGLSPACRRPVAVFGASGAGAQIRSHPERAGLCEAQSRIAVDGRSACRRRRISVRASSAAHSTPRPANRRPRRSKICASRPPG